MPDELSAKTFEPQSEIVEIPPKLDEILSSAMQDGRWIVIVARINGEQVKYDRTTFNFPMEDMPTIMRLMAEDLNSMKAD